MHITIGSRGSDLALWQARFVQRQLLERCGIVAEIEIIKTRGDQIQDLSFDKIEGKGFFTKELEQALLEGRIDLAVHSYKDLESSQPEGLCIAAVSEREDAADLLLIHPNAVDSKRVFGLKKGAVVGTSSARRQSQLLMFRPDVVIKDIRGNVPTRIEKLRTGGFDAIVLAQAGVSRLGLDLGDLQAHRFDAHSFIPAAAQGVLALQTRMSDRTLMEALKALNSEKAAHTVEVERALLKGFGAGCQVPLGIHCMADEAGFHVWVSKAEDRTKMPVQAYFKGKDSVMLCAKVLDTFKEAKAKKIVYIQQWNAQAPAVQMLRAFGHAVEGHSMLGFKTCAFKVALFDYNWVFFSSKQAVVSFMEGVSIADLKTLKIAAIGPDTAAYIQEQGLEVHFQGEGTSTRLSGLQFKMLLEAHEKVLFPISNISARTVQKQLDSTQYSNVMVYENSFEGERLDLSGVDVVAFTSSSQVRAFFEAGNSLTAEIQVLSIGVQTTETLQSFGVQHITTAYAPHAMALARTIMGV